MPRVKKETAWDEKNGKYVDGFSVGGAFYPQHSLSVSKEDRDGELYNVYICRETGKELFRRKTVRKNTATSKCWIYNNTSNVAKDKSLTRINRHQGYKDIMEYFERNSEYLQVSAGLNHTVREDVVVDIDDFIGNLESKRDYEKTSMVHARLRKRFRVLTDLCFPLPSLFQIHIKNGHAQLHYILEKSVKVYKIYLNKKGVLVYEKTDDWYRYRDIIRFVAYLLDGDMMFTGWQIKNPCIDDERVSNDFITYWNADGTFMPMIPPNTGCETIKFEDLYDNVRKYMDSGDSDNYTFLYNVLKKRKGVGSDDLFRFASCNINCFDEGGAVFGLPKNSTRDALKTRNEKSENRDRLIDEHWYWKSLSRNEFTRKYAMKLVRDSKNGIDEDTARDLVWSKLNSMLGVDGCLDGTVKRETYGDDEFERDFRGAFWYARNTYNKDYGGWNDSDRKSSLAQRRGKRDVCLMKLFLELDMNNGLAGDTLANNSLLCKDIGVKSPRTVSNYKKLLGVRKGVFGEACVEKIYEVVSSFNGYRPAGGDKNMKRKNAVLSVLNETKRVLRDTYGKKC